VERRSGYDRSDRSVGWFPVGLYSAKDLNCLRVFSSRWEIKSIAVHPTGRFVAVGTGAYDGGYFFEGELLLHDAESGTTTSLLSGLRQVEQVAWIDGETLEMLLAPSTDEDADDWKDLKSESARVHSDDWCGLRRASVDVEALPSRSRPPACSRCRGAPTRSTGSRCCVRADVG
jgi:hypothetical protein